MQYHCATIYNSHSANWRGATAAAYIAGTTADFRTSTPQFPQVAALQPKLDALKQQWSLLEKATGASTAEELVKFWHGKATFVCNDAASVHACRQHCACLLCVVFSHDVDKPVTLTMLQPHADTKARACLPLRHGCDVRCRGIHLCHRAADKTDCVKQLRNSAEQMERCTPAGCFSF